MNDTMKKLDLVDNLKYLSIFLIGLSVAVEKGGIHAIAAVIALIACVLDKERFANLRDANFNKTMLSFLIYVGTVVVISLLQADTHSARMVLRDFEKIATFLIIYILIGNAPRAFLFGVLGFTCGLLFGEATVVYNHFHPTLKYGAKRIGGMYGHPNALGAVMVLAIPFLAYAAYEFRNKIKIFLPVLAALLGAFLCLFFSGSRGASCAVIVESVLFLSIYFYRQGKFKSWKLALGGALLLSIALVLLYVKLTPRHYDSERILLWTATWKMFLDHPVIGVGFSNWKTVYRAVYISPLAKEPNLPDCHNLYLHILSSTGIVGTLAYLNFLFTQIRISVKNGFIALGKCGSDFNMADMYFVIICGMLIHNFVDINGIYRYYLLKMLFFWALCCLSFREAAKK